MEDEPLIRWNWIARNLDDISVTLLDHIVLSLLPVVLGLLIAVPVGMACVHWRWLYQPTISVANIVYALPSIALFLLLLNVFEIGTMPVIVIPLTAYSLAILIPAVVDGLRSVDEATRLAAVAMGYRPASRLFRVELAIAAPVVFAGLRIATVSSISLVTVGVLVGIGGLGTFFTDGYQRNFYTPIVVGVVLVIVLAVVVDGLILATQRLATPWRRSA